MCTLTTATKSLEAALKKPRYTYEPDSKKQSRPYPPGIPATPKAYFLTPPPTIEHPERRRWHTGDTDMDESDSDDTESDTGVIGISPPVISPSQGRNS